MKIADDRLDACKSVIKLDNEDLLEQKVRAKEIEIRTQLAHMEQHGINPNRDEAGKFDKSWNSITGNN
ncbi:MAG: hypothetical protein WC451_03285 [Patescibacteria group bacterium]|jgi:hypothetical protein